MTLSEQIEQVAAAPIMASVGNTGVFGGSGGAIIAWLGGANGAAWAGVGIGFLGLLINYWHKRAMQRLARERLELDRKIAGF